MLPNAVQPGARLVDRYLLEEMLGEAGGTAYWRAQDELLDRPVGVCLLSDEPERAEQILRAARRAAAVTDPRFLRILDASESDGVVYVVNEWVKASSLADLLAEGPLRAAEARSLALEIAQALAAAHAEGLAHLCLQPENVLRTSHGQVKVSGLAVDAAVRDLTSIDAADAERIDAEGCAAILYAALTARWPTDIATSLAPAPRENGEVCSPRQVRAGIPHDLDELACRGLGARLRNSAAAVQTPAELAALLAVGQPASGAGVLSDPAENTQAIAPTYDGEPTDAPSFAAYDDQSQRGRGLLPKLAWMAVVLVLLVGLGLAGYQLLNGAFSTADSPRDTDSPKQPPPAATRPLKIAQASTVDPPPGGNGEENGHRASRAIDGSLDTEWTTKTYNDPFGPNGLKEGVGLLLDLGRTQRVASVQVRLAGRGTDLDLRLAQSRGDKPEDYRVAAQTSDAAGQVELRPRTPVQARYVLLWLTSLPAVDGSDYRGGISEVVVRG